MTIKYKFENDCLRLALIGELDEHYAKGVREYVDEICDSKRPLGSVIFDMSELDFMDSTGIGILLGRYKRLKKLGVKTYVANPTTNVEKVLELSGIYEIMPRV